MGVSDSGMIGEQSKPRYIMIKCARFFSTIYLSIRRCHTVTVYIYNLVIHFALSVTKPTTSNGSDEQVFPMSTLHRFILHLLAPCNRNT